ncbi:MAG: YybH family protein [bacterium]
MSKIICSFIGALVLVAFTSSAYVQTRAGRLSAADVIKIKAVNEAYVSAWLKNDATAVMKTLAPNAVLIPQGSRAIEGMKAIKQFWWPSGGKTTVTAFTITTDEVNGENEVAYIRGTFKLSFTYEDGSNKIERTNNGNYLMIMKRQADGTWRISHRMWGDLPQGR